MKTTLRVYTQLSKPSKTYKNQLAFVGFIIGVSICCPTFLSHFHALFFLYLKKKDYLCSVKRIFGTLFVFILAFCALLLLVIGLQVMYPKEALHLLLNSYHTSLEDTFFKYYSMLAEWPLYALALLPILWKKIKITVFYALCELLGGAIVQILKFFFTTARPASVFENYPDVTLPVVEGVTLHHSNSFPSGHTSTFFIFMTCCALLLAYNYNRKARSLSERNQRHKLIFNCILFNLLMLFLLTLAALGGYSRIYLSQHFLFDVFVGSIIGFLTPCVLFIYASKKILNYDT